MNFLKNIRNNYSKFIKKYWYFFPMGVMRFFLKEWKEDRRYWMSLNKQEKKEIYNQKYNNLISFSFSLLLHLLLFLGVVNGVLESALMDKQADAVSLGEAMIDVQVIDGMFSDHVDPVYDPHSKIVIKAFSLNRYKVHKKLSALEKLLEQLGRKKVSVLSKASQSQSAGAESKSRLALVEKSLKAGVNFGFNNSRQLRKTRKRVKRTQLWNRVNLTSLNKMKEGVMNHRDLMKVIDKHVFHFRECYEQALLRDEELTVNAHFLLRMNKAYVQSAKINLIGKGGFTSKRQMSDCLTVQSKKLNFADNKQNLSVKFSLIFGL